MNARLQQAIQARLDDETALDDDAKLLLYALCDGPRLFESALDGAASLEQLSGRHAAVDATVEPAGAFLGSITVQGFRGIGPAATLPLEPGPGLTLVVGRNGSGKSSFAEGLEVLLTGDNRRWAGRAVVWKEGWRNLHQTATTCIEAQLVVEGEALVVTAQRTWPADAPLDGSTARLVRSADNQGALSELGWDEPLVSYRPFLSYNELGSMLDEGPSHLYDAMSQILGLEDLVLAERTLGDARKARERAIKDAKAELEPLLAALAPIDDDRARRCHAALSGRTWDLAAVDDVLRSSAEQQSSQSALQRLRQLATLEPPVSREAIDPLVLELRAAAANLASMVGTDASAARHTANLLDAALTLHAHHRAVDCPVCGTAGALSTAWAEDSATRVRELRAQAHDAELATRRARAAGEAAKPHLLPVPAILREASDLGVDAGDAIALWQQWASQPATELVALAETMESLYLELYDTLEHVRSAARAHLDQRELAWRPVAIEIGAWLDSARVAQTGATLTPSLKAAEQWLKNVSAEVRGERFAPIGDEARRVWEALRTRSNVELQAVTLEGVGNRRRVQLEVHVDGAPGAALGVMSQGELHSLALSLFLPRATLADSPFRFLVIDDPVQSMDPARVGGLARILDEVARKRQVIVFTHDDRLPSAVRDLGIDVRIIEVTRRAKSVVELRTALDPIQRHLDDARALANTDDLPENVGRRVVPGFCRAALEAACIEAVRRRRLGAGATHGDVEGAIAAATTLTQRAALALFDDAARGGDVLTAINKRFRRSAGDIYQACNKGVHAAYEGDLRDLVRGAEKLAAELRKP